MLPGILPRFIGALFHTCFSFHPLPCCCPGVLRRLEDALQVSKRLKYRSLFSRARSLKWKRLRKQLPKDACAWDVSQPLMREWAVRYWLAHSDDAHAVAVRQALTPAQLAVLKAACSDAELEKAVAASHAAMLDARLSKAERGAEAAQYGGEQRAACLAAAQMLLCSLPGVPPQPPPSLQHIAG